MGNSQEFIFKWKIRNFLGDFYKCGEAIDSPIFEVNNFGGSKWCLRLYPNGEDEREIGFFGVYLYKKKNDIYSEGSCLAFEIELIGEGGRSGGKVKSDTHTYKINERFGWAQFTHTNTLSRRLKKWPENVLTVHCHMFNYTKHKCSPDFEVSSEIPVNQILFLWKVKIIEISSKPVKKELVFTATSLYEISLNMLDNGVKIKVSQKEETISPTFIECKLSLVKSNGDVLKTNTFTHLFETNDRSDIWELPVFITKAEVDSSGIDSFYLFCETAASNGIKPVITGSEYGTMESEGNSTISRDLKVMLCNNVHADIKLKVENGEMQAHKCILASRSPVFSAMFHQNMIESQTGVINIPDFEVNAMKLFLELLHTDTVENFNYESAKKLFVIADKYQVPSLVEKCAEFLESILSLDNITEIISVADMISHNSLKKAAINFIAMNSIFIFNSDEWRYFIQENVRLAGEIISNITSNFKLVPVTTKPYQLASSTGVILKTSDVFHQEFQEGSSSELCRLIELYDLIKEVLKFPEDTLIFRCYMSNSPVTSSDGFKTGCEIQTDISCRTPAYVWSFKFCDDWSASKQIKLDNVPIEVNFKYVEDKIHIDLVSTVEDDWTHHLTCDIELMNAIGNQVAYGEGDYEFSKENRNWTFPIFITKHLEQARCFVREEIGIKFYILHLYSFISKINYICKDDISAILNYESQSSASDSDSLVYYSQHHYQNLSYDKTSADLKLRVDNDIFHVHKSLLSDCSSVFSEMFVHDMKKNNNDLIDINDIDVQTLKYLLEYLYNGAVNDMDVDISIDLLAAAERYQVLSLVTQCSTYLEKNLSVTNVCRVLYIADMINHMILKSYTVNYIIVNANKILSTPEWFYWIERNTHLATEVLLKLSKKFESEFNADRDL